MQINGLALVFLFFIYFFFVKIGFLKMFMFVYLKEKVMNMG